MQCILMHTNAFSPEAILHAGSVYIVPDKLAKQLCSTKTVAGTSMKKEKDGKEVIETIFGGPCAEYVRDPKLREKAQRLPSQPDPEDKLVMVDEDADYVDDTADDEPE